MGGKRYQTQAFDHDTGELLATGKTWGIWGRTAFNATKVVIASISIRGRDCWQRFKSNVAMCFSKSPYLSRVNDFSWWGGGLLYGRGLALLDKLMDGIPRSAWSFT
jgi:hypothetical protein